MNSAPPTHIENTIPVLAVADIRASIRFFRDQLSFKLDWGGENESSRIASVSRDGHAIMVQQITKANPSWVWIGVSSLAELWQQVKQNPAIKVVQRPTNHYWAVDMRIEDPDGNVLWFGAEPVAGVGFEEEVPEGRL